MINMTSLKHSPPSTKTFAWLLVSKLTAHATSSPTQREAICSYKADSSFVGASDISHFKCTVFRYFWCARHKARC